MGIPKLEIRNVCKYFSDAFSLRDVSLNLYQARYMPLWVRTVPGSPLLSK